MSQKVIDELSRSTDNRSRIKEIEAAFGAAGQPLSLNGRALVGEGVLNKVCRKKVKPRVFFLFNDILVYGNIVIEKRKYNQQHVIPLEDITIRDAADDTYNADKMYVNGWQICSPQKSFTVFAASPIEKTEWMKHIMAMKERLLKQGTDASDDDVFPGLNKRTSGPVEPAAIWVPDSQARLCMHCKTRKFTPLNRRHHCRKCGIVACDECTSRRFLLENVSSKPSRVCLTCYAKLSNEKFQATILAEDVPPSRAAAAGDSDDSDDSDDESPTGAVASATDRRVAGDQMARGSFFHDKTSS